MGEVIKLPRKDDYSDLVITKIIDGEPVEYFGIDEMSEEQFKRYCVDTGTEWFQRFNVTL